MQIFTVHELYRSPENSSYALATVEYALDTQGVAQFSRWYQVWAGLALDSFRKNSLGISETCKDRLVIDVCMHDLKSQLPDDRTELHELGRLSSSAILERLAMQTHCWQLGRVQSSKHDAALSRRFLHDLDMTISESTGHFYRYENPFFFQRYLVVLF